MSKPKDLTARAFPLSLLQEGELERRELLIADAHKQAQITVGVDSPKISVSLTMFLSLDEVDLALDKLHAIRNAMQARIDAKPVFTARYPASFLDTEEYEATEDQLLVLDRQGNLQVRTEPVPGRGLGPARSALQAAGYEVVKASPGPEGVFEYVVRAL